MESWNIPPKSFEFGLNSHCNFFDCCTFKKTKNRYGGLSNMASGFPLKINNTDIYHSESIYQVCRFPHLPDVQREILQQRSPITAKMKMKVHKSNTRADWQSIKLQIMQWCIELKLAQNFINFSLVLEETYFKQIVEDSPKDDFWGAMRQKNNKMLVGKNVLGKMLMNLREKYYSADRYKLLIVEPVPIKDFMLFGQRIPIIDERNNFISYLKSI